MKDRHRWGACACGFMIARSWGKIIACGLVLQAGLHAGYAQGIIPLTSVEPADVQDTALIHSGDDIKLTPVLAPHSWGTVEVILGQSTPQSSADPVIPTTNGILRQVWDESAFDEDTNPQEVSHILEPAAIEEVIPSCEGPQNWEDQYISRLSGYLHVDVTGDYTFWIAANSHADLYFGSSPDSLHKIASAPGNTDFREWDRYGEQQSSSAFLETGTVYFIQVRHQEWSHEDHISVAWSLDGGFGPTIIPGSNLRPWYVPPPEPSDELAVEAGRDRDIYLPRTNITLHGQALDFSSGPSSVSVTWSILGGPGGVIIDDVSSLISDVRFVAVGDYTLRLTATDGTNVVYDDLEIRVHDALSPNVGDVVREVWLDISGAEISDLQSSSRFPEAPSLVDRIPMIEGPYSWASRYGTRARGYIIAPETNDYIFWVAGDDETQLFLSGDDTPNALTLVARVPTYTSWREWTRFPEQQSAPIRLSGGERYYFELLHKEGWGGDHFSVAWAMGGSQAPEIIGSEFLEPTADGLDAPAFDETLDFFANAGPDRVTYTPVNTLLLAGEVYWISSSDPALTTRWEQVSGPAPVVFGDDTQEVTSVVFSQEGSYRLRLTAMLGGQSHRDDVYVTVGPALAPDTGTIYRETWLNVYGYGIWDLENRPDIYPDHPSLVDTIGQVAMLDSWADKYGTRVRGYLHPPVSGDYTFYVAGNDATRLIFQVDTGAPPQIISQSFSSTSVGEWYAYSSQASSPQSLIAGQKYYFEFLHKEGYGGDHFQVAWQRSGQFRPEIIQAWAVSPYEALPFAKAFDPDQRLVADAGSDKTLYMPVAVAQLEGHTHKLPGANTNPVQVTWSLFDGPGAVSFGSPNDHDSPVSFPTSGTYRIHLTASLPDESHVDEVIITVLPPLAPGAGSVLRQVWLNIYGDDVYDLINRADYPEMPDYEDRMPTMEAPSYWNNQYGQRLIGQLHVPQTGEYTFWISSDDASELRLNTTPGDTNVIAYTYYATSQYRWDRYSSQQSAPIQLVAGQTYYLEAIHKEHRGGDYLAVAWDGPGLNGREIISGSFLSPLNPAAPAHDGNIDVVAGHDETILWPEDSVLLQGYVFDLYPGPNPLSVTWRTVSGPGAVTFGDDTFPATLAQFAANGEYVLRLSATDGVSSNSDEITINVLPPVGPDTGSVLREVWLNLGGSYISSLTSHGAFPDAPDWSEAIAGFETPYNWGDDYGTRLRGYIYAPESGDYVFAVAGDYETRLYLSPGEDPAGATQIARVPYWSYRNDWYRYSEQTSSPVTLVAGERYYMEVLHKESSGRDFIQVAWRRPGNSNDFEVISGGYTAPFAGAGAPEDQLIVNAGDDVQWRWPTGGVPLSGVVVDLKPGPESLSNGWRQVSGPGAVVFRDAGALETEATFPAPGDYVLELAAFDGLNARADQLSVTVLPAISGETGLILREFWEGIAGSSVSYLEEHPDFPDDPTWIQKISTFETPEDIQDDYGQRLRGFLHVPIDGTYTFYVSANSRAELYLSPSEDVSGMSMIASVQSSTTPGDFDKNPQHQKSFPIFLSAGQKHYIEALHKESTGYDHLQVAWSGPGLQGVQVIQGGYLSPVATADSVAPGITLFGNMQINLQVGDSCSEPGYIAVDNVSGDITDEVTVSGVIDTTRVGVYPIYYNVFDSSGNPAPEVQRLIVVSPAPALPATYLPDASTATNDPAWTPTGTPTAEGASRFLMQASFGPTPTAIDDVVAMGYEGWINDQVGKAATLHMPAIEQVLPYTRDPRYTYDNLSPRERQYMWWTHAVKSEDQLRQRVAFALSQITVISDRNGDLEERTLGVANYYDILVRHAFGNYRQILEEVTLSPIMGIYLTTLRSDKTIPDENYAREIMQLFSIGLNHLNQDGSLKRDVGGDPIPTYDNALIIELSKAFTGWTFSGSHDFYTSSYAEEDNINPMMPFEEHHHIGEKILLGGATLPAGQTARQDLEQALDVVFNHPNVGPFVSRQLIQRLVMSNPSPDYIYRVADVFNDDGSGIRGNLEAVVRAILLDREARDLASANGPGYGKLREPILRLAHLLRAFPVLPISGPPTMDRVTISNLDEVFRQSPLFAPSVFNFFLPDYMVPGPLADASIPTPEFQITTEPQTVSSANYLHEGIADGFYGDSSQAGRVSMDLSAVHAFDGDVDGLLDYLDLMMMAGQMSSDLRQRLRTALLSLSTEDGNVGISAIQLLSTAPEYVIEK